MKEKITIKKFEIISTIFIFVLGVLLHFTYEWSGENNLIATFSAVSESTWEHLKLIFFPMLLTTVTGYFYYKDEEPTYLWAKTKGILLALVFQVAFFYTSTGIIGRNITILNIISFFISVFIGQYYSYKQLNKVQEKNAISLILLLIITSVFILFTFDTPKLGIFKDPRDGTYGINK